MALALAAVVVSALWLSAPASYMVALVASQLLSPILWDHYALLLLVPVAWLLDRGHRWAVLIPLATSVVLVGVDPARGLPGRVLGHDRGAVRGRARAASCSAGIADHVGSRVRRLSSGGLVSARWVVSAIVVDDTTRGPRP